MRTGFNSQEVGITGLDEIFSFGVEEGFQAVHFNLRSTTERVCSKGELPYGISEKLLDRTYELAKRNDISIVSVSATFNVIDPDKERLEENFRRFPEICCAASRLGCPLVTLCTGTGNRESMWKYDEYNDTDRAWAQMEGSIGRLIADADRYGIRLGIEPEISNVVSSPEKAKKLIDELGSNTLRIIFDPANLFTTGLVSTGELRSTITTAFDLLEEHIELVHGKDLVRGEGVAFTYAGNGIIDFGLLREKLKNSGYEGAIILHGIKNRFEFSSAVKNMKKIFG